MLPIVVDQLRAGDVLTVNDKVVGRILEITANGRIIGVLHGHPAEWCRLHLAGSFSTLPVPKAIRRLVRPLPIEGNLRIYRPS